MKRAIEVYNKDTNVVYHTQILEGTKEQIDYIYATLKDLEYNGCLNAHDYNATPLEVRYYNDTENN